MSSFNEMIQNITPEIYQSLKLAVEIGKWADGNKLTAEQRELSLQAMIAWEVQNLPSSSPLTAAELAVCAKYLGGVFVRNVPEEEETAEVVAPLRRLTVIGTVAKWKVEGSA